MRLLVMLGLLTVCSGCDCNGTATIGGRRDAGTIRDGGGTIPDGSVALPDGGFTSCDSTCSDDLQASIDCHGVSTSCPAGKGCSPAGCIDACAAAAAAGSTIGCDFYAAAVPPQSETQGSCYSAFVANTWNGPITLTVQRGGQSLDVSSFARIPRQSGTTLTYEPLSEADMVVQARYHLFLRAHDYRRELVCRECREPMTSDTQTNEDDQSWEVMTRCSCRAIYGKIGLRRLSSILTTSTP